MSASIDYFSRHFGPHILALLIAVPTFLGLSTAAMAQAELATAPGQTSATGSRPVPPPPPLPVAPRPGAPSPDLPTVQKIGPGLYRLGDIQISKASRSVSFAAMVNMNKGLLEYILVRTGGKTHESLFRTQIDPAQLQLAMLLIGVEGTDHPLARQGDPAVPKGDPVEIRVSYLKNGRMVQLPPETWVSKMESDKMSESGPLNWVFTGSTIWNGKFMAQLEGSMIAIYHDPVALIDNASEGGASDRIWFVREAAVPPVGTPVTLTISVKN